MEAKFESRDIIEKEISRLARKHRLNFKSFNLLIIFYELFFKKNIFTDARGFWDGYFRFFHENDET